MIYSILKRSLFYTLILIVASACSLTKSSEENVALKNTIAQVVVQYLQFSFLARIEPLESTIVLKDFLKNQNITKDDYDYRIVRLSRRWSMDNNPLIHLTVIAIDTDGNYATARLQREGSAEGITYPELSFSLAWTGSSWVIIDDNIFGKDELYEKESL